MRYSALSALLVTMTIATACGSGPTETGPPAETSEPLPTATLVSTATPAPSISASASPPPTETPNPSPTATPVALKTPQPIITSSSESMKQEPQLTMVLIRASAREVQQLRQMPLNIIRVRPVETTQTPTTKEDFLKSEVIVEAVVPTGLLAKLKELGFDVTEVP